MSASEMNRVTGNQMQVNGVRHTSPLDLFSTLNDSNTVNGKRCCDPNTVYKKQFGQNVFV